MDRAHLRGEILQAYKWVKSVALLSNKKTRKNYDSAASVTHTIKEMHKWLIILRYLSCII